MDVIEVFRGFFIFLLGIVAAICAAAIIVLGFRIMDMISHHDRRKDATSSETDQLLRKIENHLSIIRQTAEGSLGFVACPTCDGTGYDPRTHPGRKVRCLTCSGSKKVPA